MAGWGLDFDYCQSRCLDLRLVPVSLPIYISMEADDNLRVCDLIADDGRSWRVPDVARLFNDHLADRIFAIPIPVHRCQDLRVRSRSCYHKIPLRDLTESSRIVPERRIQAN